MAYAWYSQITVDNTKVSGAGDLTNFPVLVSGTYDGTGGEPDLRTVANGGNVENVDTTGGNSGVLSVPADLAFYDDSSHTTQYDHEIESYNPVTGAIVAHVRIPTLDGDADTSFYMFYGDSGVTTSQEDVTGTWDSNFKAVYHFNNSPASSGDAFDSTTSPANMTGQGSMVAGDMIDDGVGKAWQFEEASSQYARTATSIAKLNLYNSDLTVEVWFEGQDFTTHQVQIAVRGDAGAYLQYHLSIDTTSANKIRWQGSGAGNLLGATGLSINTEYYVAATRVTSTGQIYLNGATDGASGTFTQNATRTDRFSTGYNAYDPTPTYSDLIVSEIRVSSVGRSVDWLLTTYNSLKNPSTFYSVGSETSTVTPPVAAFSASPTTGTDPTEVDFTDSSTNTPTSWSWERKTTGAYVQFSTSQSPQNVSFTEGTWDIKLTATNAGGSDAEEKLDHIVIDPTPEPPVAQFSATPLTGSGSENIDFTDSSSGTPTSWLWERNSGSGWSTFSTDQNPTAIEFTEGSWSVRLTSTNSVGSDSEEKVNYIGITSTPGSVFVFPRSSRRRHLRMIK